MAAVGDMAARRCRFHWTVTANGGADGYHVCLMRPGHRCPHACYCGATLSHDGARTDAEVTQWH